MWLPKFKYPISFKFVFYVGKIQWGQHLFHSSRTRKYFVKKFINGTFLLKNSVK